MPVSLSQAEKLEEEWSLNITITYIHTEFLIYAVHKLGASLVVHNWHQGPAEIQILG